MKKTIAYLLCLLLTVCLFAACGGNTPEGAGPDGSGEPIRIVTTIFPLYDWVREILGDEADAADITMLLDSGVDLHSYQPTAADILKISTCDLFIYVGGESDKWVDDALAEAVNPHMRVVDLLEVLGDQVKEEELVEGMEHGHEEEEEPGEDEVEYDEHVWLSLGNAQTLCGVIAEELSAVDPADAGAYSANADRYIAELAALDDGYREAVAAASNRTLLFGDRFPFRYLTEDYGLEYYAAFAGCSAESEASFETIVFLANKVDELGLGAILQIESADGSIARTIRENTRTKDQEILTLNSLQSVTAKDVSGGTTYLSVMEDNLAVLRAALN